jgi:hypothetical protein
MGNPYLSNDESLILSTHNIGINGVFLDMMLTSRRLILIDNSVNPFHLRTIPLETIITVVAGMDVKGDPIITMSYMDPSGSGAPHPMDFIFTRQKGEQRAKECNVWAVTLSNHATAARNEAFTAGTLPYDPVKVIQPRMSATYRIETFSPRKAVMEAYPARAGPVASPVIPKSPVEEEMSDATSNPDLWEDAEPGESSDTTRLHPLVLEENKVQDTKEPEVSLQAVASVPDEIPPLTETEDISLHTITPVAEQTPKIPPVEEPEVSLKAVASVPDEISSRTETEDISLHTITPVIDKTPVIPHSEEPVYPLQVIAPVANETPSIPEMEEPVPVHEVSAPGTNEIPALSDAARTWADAVRTAATSVPFIPPNTASVEIPAADTHADGPKADAAHACATPEQPGAGITPYVLLKEALIPGCNADTRPAEPPAKKPAPGAVLFPVKKNLKGSHPSYLIGAIVVIILVVLAGAIIVSFNQLDSGTTPPPVVLPVITVQPDPTQLPMLIPADGVWVRIEYNGTFIGEVGNPDLMHPVSGSGVLIYKILSADDLVQASARKQDYSGDTLLIEVYKDGSIIKRSSTRTPMGSVDILIDPFTGHPPGIRYEDIP